MSNASLRKKQEQLGMNPSTASHRLVKDTLWRLLVDSGNIGCYRCSDDMCRDTFSIEHKEAWLDSENPIGLYFDQDNISFSHLTCNIKDSRKRPPAQCGMVSKYENGCRCEPCRNAKSASAAKYYTTERRQNQYKRTGH